MSAAVRIVNEKLHFEETGDRSVGLSLYRRLDLLMCGHQAEPIMTCRFSVKDLNWWIGRQDGYDLTRYCNEPITIFLQEDGASTPFFTKNLGKPYEIRWGYVRQSLQVRPAGFIERFRGLFRHDPALEEKIQEYLRVVMPQLPELERRNETAEQLSYLLGYPVSVNDLPTFFVPLPRLEAGENRYDMLADFDEVIGDGALIVNPEVKEYSDLFRLSRMKAE